MGAVIYSIVRDGIWSLRPTRNRKTGNSCGPYIWGMKHVETAKSIEEKRVRENLLSAAAKVRAALGGSRFIFPIERKVHRDLEKIVISSGLCPIRSVIESLPELADPAITYGEQKVIMNKVVAKYSLIF